MSKKLTYLQLSEEFGGTLFGPIKLPEYRLGSAEGNEVQLAEGLGVEPFHVRLIRKGGDTYYLAPVERSAAVWLYRAGQPRPELLHGPTVIRPGDGFALVTPEGVRFTLMQQLEAKPTRRAGTAGSSDDANPIPDGARRYGRRVVQEIWRRVRAAALATYFGRMAQNTWFFVKTGQIFSPLYVIGFLTMFSGWGFSIRSCNKGTQLQTQLTSAQDEREDCRAQLQAYNAGTDGGRLDFSQIVARIQGDRSWESSLEWQEMTRVMKVEVANVLRSEASLDRRWFTGSGNPYMVLVRRLQDKGLPPEVARVVAWSGTNPFVELSKHKKLIDGDNQLWDVRHTDVDLYRQCLRGPLRLSFAQATRLGLDAGEETFFDRRALGGQAGAAQAGLGGEVFSDLVNRFNQQRGGVGLDPDNEEPSRDTVGFIDMPEGACYYRKRPDTRTRMGTAAGAIASNLGASSDLPGAGQANWITARIARLYLYDLDGEQWRDVQLNSRALDASFTAYAGKDPDGASHVAQSVGRTLALSSAIPCLLLLDGGTDSYPEAMGEPPDFDACAILQARARYGEL
jgi:hypothetical protein